MLCAFAPFSGHRSIDLTSVLNGKTCAFVCQWFWSKTTKEWVVEHPSRPPSNRQHLQPVEDLCSRCFVVGRCSSNWRRLVSRCTSTNHCPTFIWHLWLDELFIAVITSLLFYIRASISIQFRENFRPALSDPVADLLLSSRKTHLSTRAHAPPPPPIWKVLPSIVSARTISLLLGEIFLSSRHLKLLLKRVSNRFDIDFSEDELTYQLKELRPSTIYEVQLESFQIRQDEMTNGMLMFFFCRCRLTWSIVCFWERYVVSAKSEVLEFQTGSPPSPPSDLFVVDSTNTAVRIGFDPFVEHNEQIVGLRVHCQPVSSTIHTEQIIGELTPDSTEFLLSDLIESTKYKATLSAITEEYLNEIACRDISQLAETLPKSIWLVEKTIDFDTSGCKAASDLRLGRVSLEAIELHWSPGKGFGSSKLLRQTLTCKFEHEQEQQTDELDLEASSALIPARLASGFYSFTIDSFFQQKIELGRHDDPTNIRQICLTTNKTIDVRLPAVHLQDKPQIYLTGYTRTTIELTWNKPNLFTIIDHPQRLNERVEIHRRLLGYTIEVNEQEYHRLDEEQCQCRLTQCHPGEDYQVELLVESAFTPPDSPARLVRSKRHNSSLHFLCLF